jgi:hypothetical protein
MHTGSCGSTSGQKYHAKGKRKEKKIQQVLYRDTKNVEMKCVIIPVIIGATGIVTKGLKFGIHDRKTSNIFSTKDSYTWNVTNNTESTAV